MVRTLAAAGLLLLLVGVVGFFAYYPVLGRDTVHLASREMIVDGKFVYDGYRIGDRVLIYGRITDLGYNTFTKQTSVQLDGIKIGWLDTGIIVNGDLRSKHAIGDNVQLKAFLDDSILAFQFWRVPALDDASPMVYTQAAFGGVAVVGFVATMAGMRNPRGAAPARPR